MNQIANPSSGSPAPGPRFGSGLRCAWTRSLVVLAILFAGSPAHAAPPERSAIELEDDIQDLTNGLERVAPQARDLRFLVDSIALCRDRVQESLDSPSNAASIEAVLASISALESTITSERPDDFAAQYPSFVKSWNSIGGPPYLSAASNELQSLNVWVKIVDSRQPGQADVVNLRRQLEGLLTKLGDRQLQTGQAIANLSELANERPSDLGAWKAKSSALTLQLREDLGAASVKECLDRLHGAMALLEPQVARLEVEATVLAERRRQALRSLLTLTERRDKIDENVFKWGIPTCGIVVILTILLSLFYKRHAHRTAFLSAIVVESIAVWLLVCATTVLGAAGKLEPQALGTLLGAIAGYALGKNRQAHPLTVRSPELTRTSRRPVTSSALARSDGEPPSTERDAEVVAEG